VKHRTGRLPLPESPDRLILTERRLRGVAIAQAIALGLAIVTPDPLIAQYPVRVIW
jgi:PIN domain nuclease of toxin-antitoxin system